MGAKAGKNAKGEAPAAAATGGASAPPSTLDADCKAKIAAKYDEKQVEEVQQWIEQITGEKMGDQTPHEWLKSGQVLCKLANTIRPGIVKKVNDSSLPFKQMENITFFRNAARELGVAESALFDTPDLYEEKNMPAVLSGIMSFGGTVQVACPDFKGPKLGVATTVASTDKRREQQMATQGGGFAGTMEVERPTERADYVVKPIDRPGSKEKPKESPRPQVQVPQTQVTKVSSPRPAEAAPQPTASSPSKPPANPATGGVAAALGTSAAPPSKVILDGPGPPTGTSVPNYGLDAELKAKQEAKYDLGLEGNVTAWIEGVTGQARGGQSMQEWLKSGLVLCELANKIKPGIVKKPNTMSAPFKQMENITFFMNAARELGVAESDMFGTPDLYENKNMGSVVSTLFAFGGAIQVSCPGFSGPKLGIANASDGKDTKREGPMATQSGGYAGTMEVARPVDERPNIR
eukprot:TRINITY_DN3448_c0_g1_i3.p1 TRINITY_DN3448_c0_g1~~TRINITY_DN3448_c0_g1_i3.p1  ORF type:complete len:463 (+),score=135.91 TRINITY_DN3448_c0_g1_i3:70-1458(+)